MSKNKILKEPEVEAEAPVSSSKERARRAAHVEAYKKANPVKAASKQLLGKNGKLISLDEWVKEA